MRNKRVSFVIDAINLHIIFEVRSLVGIQTENETDLLESLIQQRQQESTIDKDTELLMMKDSMSKKTSANEINTSPQKEIKESEKECVVTN